MVERQLPKLHTRVRFPSPAPITSPRPQANRQEPLWLDGRLSSGQAVSAGPVEIGLIIGMRGEAGSHLRDGNEMRAIFGRSNHGVMTLLSPGPHPADIGRQIYCFVPDFNEVAMSDKAQDDQGRAPRGAGPKTPDVLARIEAYKRLEIAEAKRMIPEAEMRRLADRAPQQRDFVAAMKRHLDAGRPALIAEIKKASPSKGLIREDFDPPSLARAYAEGGASCLSVLTDGPSFQGHPDYLRQARDASGLPVLRKDFLFEPYQVYQARAWGADCILVILACLNDFQANALTSTAHELGMDVLVEVHDAHELERALAIDSRLIGINNRDLRTFEVSLITTEVLAPLIPANRLVVSESGIGGRQDVMRIGKAGVHSFLVGESLMRCTDVRAATQSLLFA
jgi:indole-3-glycerol phosphate synthase